MTARQLNKNILLFIIFPLILFLFFPINPAEVKTKKPTVMFFYSSHCHICLSLEKEFLPQIKEKYKDKINWQDLEVSEPKNLSLLIYLARQYKEKPRVPTIFIEGTLLAGKRNIIENLEKKINECLSEKYKATKQTKSQIAQQSKTTSLKDLFQTFSVFTIAGAGLIDGINPCAFAVIIFFISFLGVYGYRKREIIYVGSSYCLAVFITYLLLGLGIFGSLYKLSSFYLLIKIFYYLIAVFCFALSIFAFLDYLKYKKTKQADEMILQLPSFLKKKIPLVIGSRLREKKERGLLSLALTSFVVGFLVSLLEAVCTGEVYLPTITFILKNTNLRLKGFSYLLLYNIMFILPLVIVFLLTFLGFTSAKLQPLLKRNLGKIKLAMAILFLALGIAVIFIS